jgi:hypothetical protein
MGKISVDGQTLEVAKSYLFSYGCRDFIAKQRRLNNVSDMDVGELRFLDLP